MITFQKANNKRADQTAHAQAGLRLCCAQTPENRFSRVEAHLMFGLNWVWFFFRITKPECCILSSGTMLDQAESRSDQTSSTPLQVAPQVAQVPEADQTPSTLIHVALEPSWSDTINVPQVSQGPEPDQNPSAPLPDLQRICSALLLSTLDGPGSNPAEERTSCQQNTSDGKDNFSLWSCNHIHQSMLHIPAHFWAACSNDTIWTQCDKTCLRAF